MRNRRRALAVASFLTGAALTLAGFSPPALAGPVAPAADVGGQVTTVPRPDHAVVLVLENHSSSSILGNPAAPYINSLAAAGAERGIRVPEDLSVVGFDDSPPCEMMTPPLTTVRQPLDEMANEAIRLVHEELTHPRSTGTRIELATSLVVRASTAPPR